MPPERRTRKLCELCELCELRELRELREFCMLQVGCIQSVMHGWHTLAKLSGRSERGACWPDASGWSPEAWLVRACFAIHVGMLQTHNCRDSVDMTQLLPIDI
jgi:hypothetical protein